MTPTLLTLICSPSLERPITDWLLDDDLVQGFTSLLVYGHGSHPNTLTLIEQVEGRKKQTMFQIHLPPNASEQLIDRLRNDFRGAKIYYWLHPVISGGPL